VSEQADTPQAVAHPPTLSKVVLALLAVYLIWGSTYLATRIAIASFPPFLLGGVRYLLAGSVLYGVLRRRGAPAPRRSQWLAGLLVGVLLLGLGNGLTALALVTVSSGVVAIVIATTPLWSVALAGLWGARPRRLELVGLGLGLAGVYTLQRGGAFAGSALGLWVALVASLTWALGSVWSGRLPRPAGPMAAAVQMLAGGASMLAIGLARGERVGVVTSTAVLAFVYLVVFGSLVAFTAYQFLLASTRPAVATSYAFVNPVIALLLGALLADEPLSVHHFVACGLTALAVVCVLRARLA